MPSGAVLRGKETVIGNIIKIANRMPTKAARAAEAEFDIEMKESMRRTPVRYGDLRDSHERHPAKVTPARITVEITAGGAAAPYGISVHENLYSYHPRGQAKFLESTLFESRPFMAGRIAKRVRFDNSWIF